MRLDRRDETPSPKRETPQVNRVRRLQGWGGFYRISTVRIIARPRSRLEGPLFRLPVRRIVGRMPRLQVYLPDDLYDELKRRDLPASELLQVAVRAELERRDILEATDVYLTELAAEVGEPTARQQSRADAIVRRIRDRQLHQTG